MRPFVPGDDPSSGAGIPASLMRSSSPHGDVISCHPHAIEYVALIAEPATTLLDKFKKLCYWRQVVNAENN